MTVHIFGGVTNPVPPSGAGQVLSFASPGVGSDFQTTVPAGQAWRVWGGSYQVACSSVVAGRTPLLYFFNGSTPLYVDGSGLNITASQTFTVCYYNQKFSGGATALSESAPYFAIGIRAIWLPTGSLIHYRLSNQQSGDQISKVTMLVEAVGV